MMRTSKLLTIVAVAACVLPPFAMAQEPAKPSQPPKLEKLEEGEQPAITIPGKSDSERKITQKKEKGKVTEVKVKSGKSTYYLKPNDPAGSAVRGDAQSNEIRGAQWEVKQFDLGRKKQAAAKEDSDKAPVLPPAAAPSATTK
jgi:hypothetical protein